MIRNYISAAIIAASLPLVACSKTAAKDGISRVNSSNVHLAIEATHKAIKPGQKISEMTRVTGSTAEGKVLTIFLQNGDKDNLHQPEWYVGDEIEKEIVKEERDICSHKSLSVLIKYGATIRRVYRNSKGQKLYEAKADLAHCRVIKSG